MRYNGMKARLLFDRKLFSRAAPRGKGGNENMHRRWVQRS